MIRRDWAFLPCLPMSFPVSSGCAWTVKVAPSSVTCVLMTTNSGWSTSSATILNISLWTETSLGSGNVNTPLGEFSPRNDYQPLSLWLERGTGSDSQHDENICIPHRVRRVAF